MGRSHRRPHAPHRRTSWQPVPLRLPIDRPDGQRPPGRPHRLPIDGELDQGSDPADDSDDIRGSHVVVIDLA